MSLISKFTSVEDNLIVFDSYHGMGFGDNPRYIAEALHKKHPEYKYVWLLKKGTEKNLPKNFKTAVIDGIHDKYILSKAKVIITNSRFPLYTPKKQGQYLINTWHAIYGPKYAELAASDILSKEYIEFIKANNKDVDLFISSSNWATEDYKNNYGYKGEILESGLPRDDIYFKATNEQKSQIKKSLGIKKDDKIIIYSPTFRDSGNTSIYDLPICEILKQLEKNTKESWTMLVRLHPNVPDEVQKRFHYSDKIIEASTYPDMQELMLISDLMITDYSSCMFDFIIQKKPVILYTPDLGSKHIRSLQPLFYHLPFPRCMNSSEVIKEVGNYNKEEYLTKLNDFLSNYKSQWNTTFVSYDDGKASERVAQKIIDVIESK